MSGPYFHGLGRRKRRRSGSSSDESRGTCSDQDFKLPSTKQRRVTQSDAEVIPKFRPDDRTSNVVGWLHKIDQLGEVYGWDNKDRQFIMQIRLSGSARDWYDDLEDYDLTWKGWKLALQTAFPRSTDFVDQLEEMMSRTKTDTETMTKYFHSKMSLLKKCKIEGDDATSCIIKGLPTELRANAKAFKCDTPEQLYFGYLSSLENYKRVEATNLAGKSTWRRGDSGAPMAATSHQLLPKICYACRRPGHEARDCEVHLRCEVCQRSGHTAATCWFAPSSSWQQTPKVLQNSNGAGSGGGECNAERRGTRPMQDGRVLPTPGSTTTPR